MVSTISHVHTRDDLHIVSEWAVNIPHQYDIPYQYELMDYHINSYVECV